jgi:hypothetical protein
MTFRAYATSLSMFVCFTLALLSVNPAFAAKPVMPSLAEGKVSPRVFLQSASKGNMWTAARNQSIEMSRDFNATCPAIQITLNPQMADYTVILNHLEVGLSRNNQMQIAAKNGDQLSAGEGGSIKAKVKQACILILNNWNSK